MSKPLVIFYSRTGKTRGLAERIAQHLGGDIEELREPVRRRGWLRSIIDVLRHRAPDILPLAASPAERELVVIGTPVWASHMASPLLTFLRRERDRLPRYALFVTEGSRGGEETMREIEREIGRPALAKLEVDGHELATGDHVEMAADFARLVERRAASAAA